MGKGKPITHVAGKIRVPCTHSLGAYGSRFLGEMRNKRIMGTKCHRCGSVYVPPQHFCTLCYIDVRDWVEVKDTGVVLASTVVYSSWPGQQRTPPYILSQIRLDGASTAIWHVVDGIELGRPHAMLPVKAVWRGERKGDFSDIEHFQPVEGGASGGV